MSQENKTIITPTIGRKLWVFIEPGERRLVAKAIAVYDVSQPLDGTVVYVHPSKLSLYDYVTVAVLDHQGISHTLAVPLRQAGDPKPDAREWAEWMPYQVGQAAKAEEDLAQRVDRAVKQAIGEYFKPGPIVAAPNLIGLPVHAMTDMGAGLNPHREGGIRRDAGIAQFGKSLAPVPLPDEVVAEHGFTLYEAVKALGHPAHEELKRITLCMQVLDNGHVVIGQSACADMKNFDAALGERYAREDAREKLAELKAFRQRDARHTWANAYGKS